MRKTDSNDWERDIEALRFVFLFYLAVRDCDNDRRRRFGLSFPRFCFSFFF